MAMAKPKATVNDKLEIEFQLAIEALAEASRKFNAAEKEIIDNLDHVIPVAIRRAVQINNCNALDKIIDALPKNHGAQFVKNFVAFCHAENGLNMPPDTVFFAARLGRFTCAMRDLVTWYESNGEKLDQITLSQWLAAEKAAKRKTPKDGKTEYRKALENLKKVIHGYGLRANNPEIGQLYELIQKELNK